jgi:proteasome lid subunit RPN8/RPN11
MASGRLRARLKFVAVTLTIGSATLEAIRAHARAVYPEECCGALLGTVAIGDARGPTVRGVVRAVALQNDANGDRRRRFTISGEQLLACQRLAATLSLDVVGFYHSHPDHPPIPSRVDRARAWPWYCFLIATVNADDAGPLRAWFLRDDQSDFVELDITCIEAEP